MLQPLSMLQQCWLHLLQLTQEYTHAVLDRPWHSMLSCYVSQEVDILAVDIVGCGGTALFLGGRGGSDARDASERRLVRVDLGFGHVLFSCVCEMCQCVDVWSKQDIFYRYAEEVRDSSSEATRPAADSRLHVMNE